MKKLLLGLIVALSALALSPARSQAFWNAPQCCSGFGWLKCRALNCCPSIHFHGPLYNYGPNYGGPGYEYMRVGAPFCGSYVPAYPSSYYGMGGAYPNNWANVNPNCRQQGGYGQPVAVTPSNQHQSFVPTPTITPTATSGYYGGIVPAFFTSTVPVGP